MDKTDAKILLSEIESIILNKPLAGTAVPVSAELRELQDAIAMLSDRINETCEFLRNLSIGNLDAAPPDRHNYLSANLKELHAGLRHLTWQANQVASGDYSQKVSFMGEFSDSFNKMVSQLQERERTLVTQSDALKKSMDLLIAIMDGLSDWIIVADRDSGEILYTNESAKEFFYSFDSQRFICGKSECDLMKRLQSREGNGDEEQLTLFCDISGKALHFDIFSVRWNGKNACVYFVSDVTAERNEKVKLESMAFLDELTGLFNRRYCIKMLSELLAQNREFSVALIDLDGLKIVNDLFGHTVGDEYITTVSAAVTASVARESAFACRVGGDEIILIFPETVEARATEIVCGLERDIEASGRRYPTSISSGITYVPEDAHITPEEILERADEKMYLVKKEKKRMHGCAQ